MKDYMQRNQEILAQATQVVEKNEKIATLDTMELVEYAQ